MTETARVAASSPAATATPPALPARSVSVRNGALLVSFTAVTNLADGVTKVALPLLATHLTRSPALVAGVMLTLTAPWLFAALHVGVLVDRADRRRLISFANALRLGTIATLAALVLLKALALPELYGAALALGVAEVIALTAGSALIQAVTVPHDLEHINSWVTAAETVCNEFAGPPIGGLLIGIGAAVALGATASAYALGIVLIAAVAGNFRARREPVAADQTATVTAEIRAGVSYLWSQRLLRTMCLMIAMMAGCWSAWLAILPSYATGPMRLSPGVYGLLLSALGVGGVVGAFSTSIVNRWLGRRWALFADLAGTFSMMCVPAVTTSPWLVGLAAFAGGVGGTLWTVNSRTISQRIVPAEMMGRYSAVARLLGWGTMPLGAAIAGGLAQAFGIRVAFAAGAVGMALLVIPFLRTITPSALAAADPPRQIRLVAPQTCPAPDRRSRSDARRSLAGMAAPTGSGQTVADLLAATVIAHPERPALTYRSAPTRRHARTSRAGAWHTLTWHETANLVLATMKRLDEAIGAHDTVALLADTNVRWPVVELALALSGRAIQPLDVSSTDDELRRAVSLTGAGAAIADGERRDRARSLDAQLSLIDLEEVVRLPGLDNRPHTCHPPDVEPFDVTAVLRRLGELPRRPGHSPLLYLQSTGTTGPAKVIEVSEPALLAAVSAVREESSHPFPRFLSFLPAAHISERLLTLYLSVALAGHTWFGAGLRNFTADLKACRPTVLLAPPLLLDTIREQAMRQARGTPAGRLLAASVQRTADKAIELGRRGMTRRPAGARLFGRSVRRQTGLTKVRDVLSGTAPAPVEVLGWWEAIGIPVRNVYGQTELAGATSITSLRDSFTGVGTPVKGTDVRVAPDGELLVRSRSAFTGYVGEPKATAATLQDGWLRTGDRAYIDQTGEIVLLGRVQAVTYGRDGEPVNTAPLLAQISGHFSPASAACFASPTGAGLCLYLAMRPRDIPILELEHLGLRSVAHDDIRWAQLGALLARADEHKVIGWVAIFDGAFAQSAGELGPTGETRGWRIHELHSHHLRKLRSAPSRHRQLAKTA